MYDESDLNVKNFYGGGASTNKRDTMANGDPSMGRGRRLAINVSVAKMKKGANKAALFRKRKAPLRLNPMQSIVSTNQQAPDVEGVSASSDVEKQLLAIAKAKKNMKIRRSSMAAVRSQVKTPAVLNFMRGLGEIDEGGLRVYKSEVNEHELEDLSSDPIYKNQKGNVANSIIDSWVKSFDIEKNSYESVALFAEVRLKEALASTNDTITFGGEGFGESVSWEVVDGVRTKVFQDNREEDAPPPAPSHLRIAMCSDLLRKVSGMFGRYESVIKTLTDEMMRCIYSDYDSVISGAEYINARTFYHCTPYFEQLKNCEIRRDELMEELSAYNDGIDLRKAITKCSVGVRTMFNDARRAIRDIIFRVWKNYVSQRRKKMNKMRQRVLLEPPFKMWKSRHQRFIEHGYFYDSGSDVDSDDEELRKEEEEYDNFEPMNMRSHFANEVDGSSYQKLLERMKNNPSPTLSVSSTSSEESPAPPRANPLTRMRAASKTVIVRRRASSMLNRLSGHHKLLKIIKEEPDETGRMVKHCERRRCHVNLVDMACQTDFDQEVKVVEKAIPAPSEEKKLKQSSLGSILGGGKKEKPLSLDNGLQLIPSLYEQYLIMLANPGPDTVGKHLNFINFTKEALVRKFGIKKIAMKQFRALAALISSKKGLEHPRIRVFATLYGLSTHANEEGTGYSPEYVDFFFHHILPNVFNGGAKQVNAILGAKGHSDIDLEKFLKRMEEIFPNFLKKDGFKYMVLEDKIEKKMSRKTKGIEMVDADDVIECLINHWEQELILGNPMLSWDIMRLVKNFQQRVKAILREKKTEHEAEHKLEEKWGAKYPGDGFPEDGEGLKAWMLGEAAVDFADGVGGEQLKEVYDKLIAYKEKKKKVAKRGRNNEVDVKTTALTIPQFFAVTIWRMKLLRPQVKEKGDEVDVG
ncbi:hypothetical protein TrRE_jg12855 [Triparma retinervis]|uniref:Uncharacterized protein n=1 Tax=Triparma retinervis TaxID=2557542 RepID=A0A9W7FA11_9STRA|nr:hypothetical protein TrRE_jg12855 [Triparma retinervis]